MICRPVAVFLGVLLLTLALLPEIAEARKSILLVFDEDKDFPGLAIVNRSLREVFRSEFEGNVEFYSESLNLSQFRDQGHDGVLRDYYRRKYANTRLDLIVAIMGPSLEFLLRHGEALFPGIPIVFCGAGRSDLEGKTLGANVTGVLVKREFASTLEIALRLQPDTGRVFVVGGTSSFDRQLQAIARRDFEPFERRAVITYLTALPMDDLLQTLSRLPPHSLVLYLTLLADGAGRAFVPHDALELITRAANAPVYVSVDQYLGRGAVGGHVYSLNTHGRHAAEVGLRILRGEAPANIPIAEQAAYTDIFDWRQLQRWGLDESRLPPGAVIAFAQRTVWERYRWYILGALVIIGLQSAMIVDLLLQRTRRRRAEVGLLESQQFMELATEAGGIGLWVRDLGRGNLWVNPRLRSLLGFGQSDVLGVDDILARVHPDDRPQVMSVVERAQESGMPFDLEFRTAELPSIPQRWIAFRGQFMRGPQGQLLRPMGTMVDITARKLVEEKLSESEENFRRLVETTAAVIWQADIDTWMFSYVGPQAVKLLGFPLEQWYEKDFWISHLHPEDRERTINTCLTMSKSVQEFDFEYRMIKASGEVVWIHDIVNCQRHDGEPILRGLMLDITERKRAESELRQNRDELAHVMRIATMGELSASLAHELNQPLTAILSNAQAAQRFLSSKPADVEEVREILRDIVDDNNRAGEIIRRMRALVKKEAIEFSSLGLMSVIREIGLLVHSDAVLRDVRILLDVSSDLPHVRGDKVQLQQVLINLLLNAFDAVKDCPREEREVLLRAESNGAGVVEVSVSDRGTGLTVDKLDKIFQPFYTTKGEGLGMGLSICRSIIEAHGGRLWAENNPDRGATFYFTVPVDRGGGVKRMME